MARGALTLTAVVLACVACARSRRAEWRPRETNEAVVWRPPPLPPTGTVLPPPDLRDPLVDHFVPRVEEVLARRAMGHGDAGVSVDASAVASEPSPDTLRGLTPRALVQRCRRARVEPREMPASMLRWNFEGGLHNLVYSAGNYTRNVGPPLGGPPPPTMICHGVADTFRGFLGDCGQYEGLSGQPAESVSASQLAVMHDGLAHRARALRYVLRRPNVEAAAGAFPGWWCQRLRAWILLLSGEPDALDALRAGVASPEFLGDIWSLLLLAEHDARATTSQRADWYTRVAADNELHVSFRAYALYRLAWWTRGPAAAEPLTRAVALLDVVEPGWFGRRVSAALTRDACAIVRDAPRSER